VIEVALRNFGKEVDSFEVRKIWLEWFGSSRIYSRARALICCELDLAWVIEIGTTMVEGKMVYLEFEMIWLGHLSVEMLTWEIG
jgi:hypothetical protein